MLVAEWNSDLDMVVLEVPQEGTKQCTDSERTCWRNLIHEMESEAEVVDCTINSHEIKRLNRDDGAALKSAVFPSLCNHNWIGFLTWFRTTALKSSVFPLLYNQN